jgi:hypothetical protein
MTVREPATETTITIVREADASVVDYPRRELAYRVSGGIEVTLYWSADDNSTSVEVWQPGSGETLLFAVARECALEAFYHPFAHLPIGLDDPTAALEA